MTNSITPNSAQPPIMPAPLRPAADVPAKAPEPTAAIPAKVAAPKPDAIHYNPAETLKKLEDAVSMLNEQVDKYSLRVSFSIDKSLASPIVTMRDANSGEVIRQFPSEQTIAMAHSIDALKGSLHNSQV